MEYKHVPVMLAEVLEYLNPRKGCNYIDCTLGGGSYSIKIAGLAGPAGKVLGIDMDRLAIDHAGKTAKQQNINNLELVNDNFKNLSEIVKNHWTTKETQNIFGIVFDLGLSSAQLEDRTRGFSFRVAAPLNMAFGDLVQSEKEKTKNIINKSTEPALERIIRLYGEERYAKNIAREIVKQRKGRDIDKTNELTGIIEKAVPSAYRRNKIHFATKTFQALRIATNEELMNLQEALPRALDLLAPGGRLAVVSYHSLEDRIVKHFFSQESRACLCAKEAPICSCGHQKRIKKITKKALKPSAEEIKNNQRSRSARLRVAEKI